MKQILLFILIFLMMALYPSYAETISEQAIDKSRLVNPYEGIFSYKANHGLQPDVNLHYSSAGGNGLLGVEWSIAQPAVTIDTRWGVPRYDLRHETEAYLVNGEPILLHNDLGEALPLPHMSSAFIPRRTQSTRFYARDQRNQSKMVRHGQTPDRYWYMREAITIAISETKQNMRGR